MTDYLFSRTIEVTIRSASGQERIFFHDESSDARFNIWFESEFGGETSIRRNRSGNNSFNHASFHGRSKIRLYNVLPATVDICLMEDGRRSTVGLKAGYGGELLPISSGEIIEYHTEASGNDSYLEIVASPFQSNLDKRVDMTLANTTVGDALQALAGAVGIQTSIDISNNPQIKIIKLHGKFRDEMEELVEMADAVWRFEDSVLKVFHVDRASPGGESLVLDRTSGMIGTPVKKDGLIVCKTLLRPEITYGTNVTLQYLEGGKATTVTGVVRKGTHRGGSYDSEFITESSVEAQ